MVKITYFYYCNKNTKEGRDVIKEAILNTL